MPIIRVVQESVEAGLTAPPAPPPMARIGIRVAARQSGWNRPTRVPEQGGFVI